MMISFSIHGVEVISCHQMVYQIYQPICIYEGHSHSLKLLKMRGLLNRMITRCFALMKTAKTSTIITIYDGKRMNDNLMNLRIKIIFKLTVRNLSYICSSERNELIDIVESVGVTLAPTYSRQMTEERILFNIGLFR
jgi:hypothetical protein